MTTKTRLPAINLGSPGEEISKKDLHAISQRFKNLHQFRQKRIQQFLQPRQQVFLDILPLIFHINHPLLPGYISTNTPAGIPNYSPKNHTIHAAKYFSKTFKYKRKALKRHPIHGLFLMGSVSSIAFSKTSDLDIWLCHESGLEQFQLIELQNKATVVEKWAESLRLEVHFFLIDSEQFKSGQTTPISDESSGQTQHFLLLEEFYRTSIYIAGRIPAWWLVPPNEEKNYPRYVEHLIINRFISPHEIIDFGGLKTVPATEYISATLWHLFKSINSPYKSLLKLLLMESYASEYPDPEWLCFIVKKAIYIGDFGIDDLDPYLLIYQKVDQYLQNAGDPHRLDLARHCFYLKVFGDCGFSNYPENRMQRQSFLEKVADRWGWPEKTLAEMGSRKTWDIFKAVEEHKIIIRQLTQCFRMTKGFAGQYVDQNFRHSKDLQLLGRKLFSFLEKKPGKIEIITTRANVQVQEPDLFIQDIQFASGANGMGLFKGITPEEELMPLQAIKKSENLFELLSWIVINGLYHRHLKIHSYLSNYHFIGSELQQNLTNIKHFFSDFSRIHNANLNTYHQANKLLSNLIFVNSGQTSPEDRIDGRLVISERSDVLSYGHERKNFIQYLDRVSISTWGEISTSRFVGIEGLFNCFTEILNNSANLLEKKLLTVICNTELRAKSITLRINDIFSTLVELYAAPDDQETIRYILPGGSAFFIFQNMSGALHYWSVEHEDSLLDELSRPNSTFSSAHFDPEILQHTPIPLLYAENKTNTIQVFYFAQSSWVDLYIIDEKGTLYTQQHSKSSAQQVLNSYAVFFEEIFHHGLLNFSINIEYYEIQNNSAGTLSCVAIELDSNKIWQHLSLRISGETTASQETSYSIYCDEQEFSASTYGDQLFAVVKQHIIQHRKGNEIYPIYITDIDVKAGMLSFNNPANIQTADYLQFKQKIEGRLNA